MEKHQYQIYEKTTQLDKITAELSLAQAEAEEFAQQYYNNSAMIE